MRMRGTGAWIPVVLGAAAGLWALGVHAIVPALIRAAHSGNVPLLSRLMPSRTSRPVDGYLEAWQPIARASVVLVLTTALMVAAVLLLRQHARRQAIAPPKAPAAPITAGEMLLIAVGFGLATGFAEAYYLMLRAYYQGLVIPGFLNVSQHAVWMSPLANLLVFSLAGGLLVLAGRASGGRLAPATAIAGLAGLGAFGLVMATARILWPAAALLSLGVAWRFRPVVAANGDDVARAARRFIPWMMAVAAALGVVVTAMERARESRQLAAAGTPAPGAPDVLFIVLDTERAASTSLHGSTRPTTPVLERLAGEGVQFERAIAPTSWTLPSHAAMFTGREARDLGLSWHTPLDEEPTTLAEVLTERGYATAGFVANQYYGSDFFGLDRGFGRWEDQPIRPGLVLSHAWLARSIATAIRARLGVHQDLGRKTADAVNASALRWITAQGERPYFAFLNYFDAHEPYLPPKPWNLHYSTRQPLYSFVRGPEAEHYSLVERQELETAYQASIAYLDNRVGQLVEAVRRRDPRRKTLLIITSDHGEDFGASGQLGHRHDLTIPMVHVPLVVVYPGEVPAGARVDAPVDLRHLAATVLGMTGGMDPRLDGESLARYWAGEPTREMLEPLLLKDGSLLSLITDSLQLVRHGDGREWLFNHRRDLLAEHDLSGKPELAAIRDSLRRLLLARVSEPR